MPNPLPRFIASPRLSSRSSPPVLRSALWFSLAFIYPSLAQANCSVTGSAPLSVSTCASGGIAYRAGAGSVELTVDGETVTDNGVLLGPSTPDILGGDTSGGPYDQILHLTGGTAINNNTYSGVVMQTYKANRNATVTADSSVRIVSSGGYGGIWVRNDTSGTVAITSAATVTAHVNDGVTGVTNLGGVSVTNSGQVTSDANRGLYADGGYNNPVASPVQVSITNQAGGQVGAYLAGARSINYQGLSQIINRGTLHSTTRQGMVSWSANGPVSMENSGTATAENHHALQAAGEYGDISVLNSGQLTARDDPANPENVSGFAALYAEVDMDPSTVGAYGNVTVTNQGSGVISAPNDFALYAATPNGSVTVTNQGSVSGQHGVTLTATGGSLNFTNGGTVTASGTGGIGLDLVRATGGTVLNTGTLTATSIAMRSAAGAALTQIRNLGTLSGGLQLAGPGDFSNGGTLTLPVGASAIAGAFTQRDGTSPGVLRLTVAGSSQFATLTAGGALSLPTGSRLEVVTGDPSLCRNLHVGDRLASVLRGSSITQLAGTVTDDCTSLDFVAQQNGNGVDLVVQAAPGVCGTATGQASAFAPSANLCALGQAGAVTPGNPWRWTCTNPLGGAAASCQAPNSTTGTASGPAFATVSGSNQWVVDTLNSGGFIPATGHAKSPPSLPPNVYFPHGLFDIRLISGTPGTGTSVTVSFPAPLPAGTVWWKYGPTHANPTPHWYIYPNAVFSGNQVTLPLVDGQDGDDTLVADSVTTDPGGPGFDPATGLAVPTLSEWARLGLTLCLGLIAALGLGRRPGLR